MMYCIIIITLLCKVLQMEPDAHGEPGPYQTQSHCGSWWLLAFEPASTCAIKQKIGSVGLHCQNAIKQTRVSQLDRAVVGHSLAHGLGHPCAPHQTRPLCFVSFLLGFFLFVYFFSVRFFFFLYCFVSFLRGFFLFVFLFFIFSYGVVPFFFFLFILFLIFPLFLFSFHLFILLATLIFFYFHFYILSFLIFSLC
jgi:hypothetical protein